MKECSKEGRQGTVVEDWGGGDVRKKGKNGEGGKTVESSVSIKSLAILQTTISFLNHNKTGLQPRLFARHHFLDEF